MSTNVVTFTDQSKTITSMVYVAIIGTAPCPDNHSFFFLLEQFTATERS